VNRLSEGWESPRGVFGTLERQPTLQEIEKWKNSPAGKRSIRNRKRRERYAARRAVS
jgi:hypothetical protein